MNTVNIRRRILFKIFSPEVKRDITTMTKDTLKALIAKLTEKNVTLVAISKTKPVEQIQEVYATGQRDFGENKAQEMKAKHEQLPDDIRWHMVGHLQRNKVKYIAPFVHLIHSVDSPRLLKEINKRAEQNNRVIPCLLQIYINRDENKFGFDATELNELLDSGLLDELQHISIQGLMGMATYTDDTEQVKQEFGTLKTLFDELKDGYFKDNDQFNTLSMGMSGDWEQAVEMGSNMVRIGSMIFGARDYN